MKHRSRASLSLVATIAAVIVGSLFLSLGHASQENEKSLNIGRYRDEPFELVDLKVGRNSIKSGIRSKVKDSHSQSVMDSVRFTEKDDWYRNVKVRLRNISGSPIYGFSVSLFFQHTSTRTAFQLPLRRADKQDLTKQPLQSGDEIDLEVNDTSVDETIAKIRQYGLDPNELPVLLSVDSAFFNDDFMWSKGSFLRRDPRNRQKWNAVDKSALPGASRLKKPTGFLANKLNHRVLQTLQQCQESKAGFEGFPCSDDGTCYRIVELGNGVAGFLTDFNVPGKCKRHPGRAYPYTRPLWNTATSAIKLRSSRLVGLARL